MTGCQRLRAALNAAQNENAILRGALYDIVAAKPGDRTTTGKRFNAARFAAMILELIGDEMPNKLAKPRPCK
jgi:hypothetical protein